MMNEQCMHCQVSIWIHSNWQKECRTTKEKVKRTTPMKMVQAGMA